MNGGRQQLKKLKAFLSLFEFAFDKEALAFAIICLVMVVFRWDAILAFNSRYLGGVEQDAGLYIWLTESNIRDLFSLPWFNTEMFYPYTRTLAWSDNFILPSLFAWLFNLTGIGKIAAYNLVILGATVLNGFLTYLLCYRLRGDRLAALGGGALFMCLSWFSGNLGHPQLQFAFWIPLSLLALFSFYGGFSWCWAVVIGLSISGAFLCGIYYSVFIVALITVVLIGSLILKPEAFYSKDWIALAGIILGLLPVIPFLLPYLDAKEVFGSRGLYEAHYFSATLLSYFSFSPFAWLYKGTASLSHAEAQLGSGLIIIAMAVLAYLRITETKALTKTSLFFLVAFFAASIFSIDEIHLLPYVGGQLPNYLCAIGMWIAIGGFAYLLWKVGRIEMRLGYPIITNRNLLAIFLFGALVFYFLSFGPQANPTKGHFALGIFRVFYEILPGFDSIRAIGRCGIVCLFCLCVLYSLMVAHFKKSGTLNVFFVGLTIIFSLGENFPFVYPLEMKKPNPEIFGKLLGLPDENGAVVVLPFTSELKQDGQVRSWGDFAEKNVDYMNWVFDSKHPLVNGYSGQRTKITNDFPARLASFPKEQALKGLGIIGGLKYVVYLPSYNPDFEKRRFEKELATAGNQLTLLEEDHAGNKLFQFNGEQLINRGDFELMVPSWPEGKLEFDLKADSEADAPEILLDVMNEEYFPGGPLASFRLAANGNWRGFKMNIPLTSGKVRPLRLKFKSDKDIPIYMKNSSYKAKKFKFWQFEENKEEAKEETYSTDR